MPKTDHHIWETKEDNQQPLNKQDKWSLWECKVCHAKFKFYYGRHPDWMKDRDEQEIDLFCGEIGRAEVAAEAIKEMEEKNKKEVVILKEMDEKKIAIEEEILDLTSPCFKCGTQEGIYTLEGKKYCWSCRQKQRTEKKMCEHCDEMGAQNECKRCHQPHCDKCSINGTICEPCSVRDKEFLSFLVGKAQYHNWNDAASHFYGNKRQRTE